MWTVELGARSTRARVNPCVKTALTARRTYSPEIRAISRRLKSRRSSKSGAKTIVKATCEVVGYRRSSASWLTCSCVFTCVRCPAAIYGGRQLRLWSASIIPMCRACLHHPRLITARSADERPLDADVLQIACRRWNIPASFDQLCTHRWIQSWSNPRFMRGDRPGGPIFPAMLGTFVLSRSG